MFERKMQRAPTHPGEVLRQDVLPAMNVTQAKFADMLGLSRQTIHSILSGTGAVTAETALKLGTLFGNSPQFWLNLQSRHDLWNVQREMDPEVLSRINELHNQYVGAVRG